MLHPVPTRWNTWLLGTRPGRISAGEDPKGVTIETHRPQPTDDVTFGPARDVTVVVCTYAEERWDRLVDAVASLRSQRHAPHQVLVVVDHNERLLRRARSHFPADIETVASVGPNGLSGARNTGVQLATGDVVAFLDDDAVADPGWLEELLAQYGPAVAGTGGVAVPVWPGAGRPRWFPSEFDWVVGCSYRGQPEIVAPQRNLVGAAMSFRRTVFDRVGAFDPAMGRIGSRPVGCEETEFAIRLRRILAGVELLHVPPAIVRHHVAPDRTTVGYFLRRCYSEGISKAAVTRRVGRSHALSSERRHLFSTLPRGCLDGLNAALEGDPAGIGRAAMIGVGLAVTVVGYLVGTLASLSAISPPRGRSGEMTRAPATGRGARYEA